MYTLKHLQELLGTVNYVGPHCGPESARVAEPIRALLKPGAQFVPNEQHFEAIENLKG